MNMDLQTVDNARELGGLPTADGRRIRRGLLFRSGELSNASQEDIAALEALGIRHVVDFRDRAEIAQRPDKPLPGAQYVRLTALPPPPSDEKPDFPPDPEAVFPFIYRMLGAGDEAKTAYRAFFELLLLGDGPVLWHCRQGKDRTGVAALLLETALGVSQDAVLTDYLATNEYMLPQYARAVKQRRDPELMRTLMFVREDWLRLCLEEMEKAYGSVSGYLRGALRLTDGELARLKTLYLE